MNKVVLKGRLTKDIELRYTQSAEPKAFAMFSVVVNRFKKDECDFINCKAWGKTAEFLSKYFTKGQEILLEGRIEVNTSDTDGVKTTFTNVVAEQVEFCGNKGGNTTQDDTIGSTPTAGFTPTTEEDDDLPF